MSQRITHGRHCTCSSCAREDWTNPGLAPCGMHGSDCPGLYAPLGLAGDVILSKAERDRRAATIAELLRMGHDPKKVSAAVKIADAGGSVYDAMEALR